MIGRQHRKDIYFYLKPFRGNNNIINLNTSYKKMYNFLLINIYYYYYYYYIYIYYTIYL